MPTYKGNNGSLATSLFHDAVSVNKRLLMAKAMVMFDYIVTCSERHSGLSKGLLGYNSVCCMTCSYTIPVKKSIHTVTFELVRSVTKDSCPLLVLLCYGFTAKPVSVVARALFRRESPILPSLYTYQPNFFLIDMAPRKEKIEKATADEGMFIHPNSSTELWG